MKIQQVIQSDLVDFSNIPPSYYLLGLLSAFENRFQAMADKDMGEISWKQFFAIICIDKCKEPPTLNELSEILGSSHQNVKQILLKLEKKGFIVFEPDKKEPPSPKSKQLLSSSKTSWIVLFIFKTHSSGEMLLSGAYTGVK